MSSPLSGRVQETSSTSDPLPGVLALVCDIPFFPGKMGVDFFNLRHLAHTRHVGVVGPRYDVLPPAGVENLRRSVGSCYFWPDPMPGLVADQRLAAGRTLGRWGRVLPRWLKRRVLHTLLGLPAGDDNGLLKLAILANLAPYLLAALAERPWQALVVIQSDTRAWLDYLPPHLATVVYFHDVRSEYLERRARYDSQSGLHRRQARLAERQEREICARADAVGFVSELDRQRAERRLGALPRGAVAEIPLDLDYYAPPAAGAARERKVVLFTGLLAHPPNLDAARFFIEQAWGRVRRAHPEAVLQIVGAFPGPELRAACAAQPNVELHADVPDIRPFFAGASVYVVPMRFGGGVRQKVLEAWAMRVPVVLTTMAAEGSGAQDGVNCLISDDAAGLARRVSELLQRPRAAATLVRAGREHVEAHHALGVAAAQFGRLVDGGIAHRRSRPFRAAIDLGWLQASDPSAQALATRAWLAALAQLDRSHEYRLLAPRATLRTLRLPYAFRALHLAPDSWRERLRPRLAELANRLGADLRTHTPMGAGLLRLRALHHLDCDFVHVFQGAPTSDLDLLPQVRSLRTVVSATAGDVAAERERRACLRAGMVLCPSEVTRQEVHRRWGVSLERLRVAYPGPVTEPPRRPARARAALRRGFELAGPYVLLWVDGVWPEGPVSGLALALAELPPALALVVVADVWPPSQVPAPTLVGRTRRVLRPELLTPHERWGLLAEAEIVLRVSGPADFDPVLTEGLRVGAPLVLADTPLARELAGEDAILAAADQAEAWARALVELGTSTQRREELARGARRRAERFAWLAHARTTLAAYEALHAGNL